MKKEDVIREVQSMLPDRLAGYQVAKRIVRLAEHPPDTFVKISRGGMRRSMSSQEAKRLVDAAKARIALVDSTD
jgi:hypothetical protein